MKPIDRISDHARSYATVRQLEYIDAIDKHGSMHRAAKALGIDRSGIGASIKRLQAIASLRQDIGPGTGVARRPEWHIIHGTSTLVDADGAPKQQWVKTSLDDAQRQAAYQAAFAAMAAELPRVKATPKPAATDGVPLANLHVLTDYHVGMLAWAKETGEAWDISIAERTIRAAFLHTLEHAPKAHTGVVAIIGDFLHWDGLAAVTPTSGHQLDADGRVGKMIEAGIRITRGLLAAALATYARVDVVIIPGNHDPVGAIWLQKMMRALHENEPRIHIQDNERLYAVVEHGACMLAFHHGHTKKNEQLPEYFAAAHAKEWGRATFRVAHTGHRHHVHEKEHSGMRVMQHTTLAAKDAYAARGGWLSERAITCITYHKRHGEVARTTVTPSMLEQTT